MHQVQAKECDQVRVVSITLKEELEHGVVETRLAERAWHWKTTDAHDESLASEEDAREQGPDQEAIE